VKLGSMDYDSGGPRREITGKQDHITDSFTT